MKLLPLCLLALTVLVAPSVQAADSPAKWLRVDPESIVLIDTRYGQVAVELAPQFAPRHVERMKALVRAHFFDGLSFYRVVDGFVAQGGADPPDDQPIKAWPMTM